VVWNCIFKVLSVYNVHCVCVLLSHYFHDLHVQTVLTLYFIVSIIVDLIDQQ